MEDQPIPLAQAIRIKLQESLGPVGVDVLLPHLGRDAVFVVASSVDLLDCGVAIAMDDVTLVQGWIERGELRKPSRAEREQWPQQQLTWRSVVVQPFVLIQDISAS